MAHALIFHSAADSEHVRGLLVGLDGMQVMGVRGPAPAAVQFGGRVVVAWSQHAAAEYAAAGTPTLPRDAVVIQLDDTPLPAFLAPVRAKVRVAGDGADAGRVRDVMVRGYAAPVAGASPRPELTRLRRDPVSVSLRAAEPAPRAVGARRRQTHSASVVASAGAMGTLAAVALGAVFPGDTIITPSFAADPTSEASDTFARHEHLAQSHSLVAPASFDAVTTVTGVSVTFSADEMQALAQTLAKSDQELNAARAWSDRLISRLDGISSRAPEAMPAMASVPRGPTISANASTTEQASVLAQAEPAAAPLALRERFTQVEPVAYAVDRLIDVTTASVPASRDAGA